VALCDGWSLRGFDLQIGSRFIKQIAAVLNQLFIEFI
jgi:hypothetical protein